MGLRVFFIYIYFLLFIYLYIIFVKINRNNCDEVLEANLSEALKMINKLQELDIIFLKSASIDKNVGIYVYHL